MGQIPVTGKDFSMKDRLTTYKGKDIDVIFSVYRCTHVSACVDNLHSVFDTSHRPWITPDEATADQVAEVCEICPTGALHFVRHDGGAEEKMPSRNTIIVGKNGPLYFMGNIILQTPQGEVILKDNRIALCRFGKSTNMPICDETHEKINFRDGAIHYHRPNAEANDPSFNPSASGPAPELKVTIMPYGPFILKGPFELLSAEGMTLFKGVKGSLCSCGYTQDQPWCDGSHKQHQPASE
jgi:uncharacterized Fe-S cluster protein YjdI/CDGSH-type Zn-finger protein